MTNTEKVNLAIEIIDDARDSDTWYIDAVLSAVETVLRFESEDDS